MGKLFYIPALSTIVRCRLRNIHALSRVSFNGNYSDTFLDDVLLVHFNFCAPIVFSIGNIKGSVVYGIKKKNWSIR